MFNLNKIQVLINATNARKMYSQEVVLSQKNREQCVKKMKEIGKITLQYKSVPSIRSAVLIPLCIVDNEVSILYTLRSLNLNSHRGQVSFPGGKEEKADKNLVETAIRETEEELGISRHIIDIWGTGQQIIGKPTPSILPVVGFLKNYTKSLLNVNPDEVDKVFTVSLKELCNPANIGYTHFTGYSLPVFLGGEHRIWGLTALMTHMFLMCLLPKEAYSFQLQYTTPVKPAKASL